MRKALEKAEYDKTENWKLACHGANILADLTEKMHKFRETTDADILAWHKNYRNQLAAEREENLNLRNQINDMRAAACRANEHLRQMRCGPRGYETSPSSWTNVIEGLPVGSFDEVTLHDAWGGLIIFMPSQHPAIGMAPADKPFFCSPGPDRKFLTRDDNLYSYEED